MGRVYLHPAALAALHEVERHTGRITVAVGEHMRLLTLTEYWSGAYRA